MLKKGMTILLVCCLLLSLFCGCAQDGGALMELDGCTLSVNAYELLLTRMKGKLYYTYQANVASDSFWNTVMSTDGTTYNEFYTVSVLTEAYKYVEAAYMFREMGLTLPQDRIDEVEEKLDALVKDAGSKTALNGVLMNFGVNYNQLREHYLAEARIRYLQEELYGAEGEKIEQSVKDAYYRENYVAFRQIFLANYDYVFVTDANGDLVYYGEDDKIAYDRQNGHTRQDEFGNTELDDAGNVIYYTDDGKVAYDTVSGEPRYKVDTNGTPVVKTKDETALAELKARVAEIAADATGLDEQAFSALAEEVSESGSGTRVYLRRESGYYATQSASYLDDIAAAVQENEVGGVCTVTSSSGYHILFCCEPEPCAYDSTDKNVSASFADFYSLLIGSLFSEACNAYKDRVVINQDVYEKAPTIKEVSYENKKY